MVVVGACLGLGTVKEWRLCTSAYVTERRLVRNLKGSCTCFLFPVSTIKRFGTSLTDKSPKFRATALSDLSKKQPDGQTDITASPRHTKHKMTLSNDAGRNISRCNDEVDVRHSSS